MTDDTIAYLKAHIDKTRQAAEASLARLLRELNDGVPPLPDGEEQWWIEEDLRWVPALRKGIDLYEEAAARDPNGRDAAFALSMLQVIAAMQVQLDRARGQHPG